MNVKQVEFLEPVESPARGPGVDRQLQRYRAGNGDGPLKARVIGPGVVLETDGGEVATLVPWANVRFCQVAKAELPQAGGKAK